MYIVYEEHIETLEAENEELKQELLVLKQRLKYYRTEGSFYEDGDSSEPAVTTSDSEIFVGWQEKPTGNNEVYNIVGTRIAWGTDGASGSCNSTYYDYCADCIENTTEDQTCGLNNRGVETRTCTDGGRGPWGACNDPDVCVDDTTSSQACGLNNRGAQSRTCTAGQWPAWGTCNGNRPSARGCEADVVLCRSVCEPHFVRDPGFRFVGSRSG